MSNLKSSVYLLAVLIFTLFMTTGSATAQPPGGQSDDQGEAGQMQGGPMGQQGGPGGMQMDQEQMQQMMAQRYQELLGISDEEWAVIGPYILKVSTLSQSSQSRGGGMRMMMGGRGNMPQGAQGQEQAQAPQGQESNQDQRGRGMMRGGQDENLQALQTLLEDENATTDEIKTKLSALRKAREAARQELAVAQKELRKLLTLRQEAMLVVMGLLE